MAQNLLHRYHRRSETTAQTIIHLIERFIIERLIDNKPRMVGHERQAVDAQLPISMMCRYADNTFIWVNMPIYFFGIEKLYTIQHLLSRYRAHFYDFYNQIREGTIEFLSHTITLCCAF